MNYQAYLKSDHWKSLRAAKLHSVNDRCEKCKRRSNLQVHHLTYERRGAELLSDLAVLCERCHEKEHDLFPVYVDDWKPQGARPSPKPAVTLTIHMVRDMASNGLRGLTNAHFSAIGITSPPKSGWLRSLVGKTVSARSWSRFCNATKRPNTKPAKQIAGWDTRTNMPIF